MFFCVSKSLHLRAVSLNMKVTIYTVQILRKSEPRQVLMKSAKKGRITHVLCKGNKLGRSKS